MGLSVTGPSYHKTDTQIANLSNLIVNGIINIRASSAGGVIGYLGPQTNLRDVTLEIQGDEASKIVAYNFFAGGIVAECYGNIDMARAQHDLNTQKEIENTVSDYYHSPSQTINRGTLRLFDDTSDGNIISTYSPIGNGTAKKVMQAVDRLELKNITGGISHEVK